MGAHPPAWYHDPHVTGQLRRWDGKGWTNDVRPIPGWMRGLTLAPSPPPTAGLLARPMLARRLWTASTVTLALALLILLSLLSTMRSQLVEGEEVNDPRFLAGAAAVCDRYSRDLTQAGGDATATAEVTRRLIAELRDVEVVAEHADAVGRWLAAWDARADAVGGYAEAVAGDDRAQAARLSNLGAAAGIEINRFSYANGLQACVLEG